MNDEEEACTPRADEATPLDPGTKRPRRRLALGAATLALGAFTATGRRTTSALFGWSATWGNDYQCRVGGWIELSKYTITTSSPELDAEFAMRVFGATDQLTGGDEGADDDTTNLEDPSTYWDCNGKVHIPRIQLEPRFVGRRRGYRVSYENIRQDDEEEGNFVVARCNTRPRR